MSRRQFNPLSAEAASFLSTILTPNVQQQSMFTLGFVEIEVSYGATSKHSCLFGPAELRAFYLHEEQISARFSERSYTDMGCGQLLLTTVRDPVVYRNPNSIRIAFRSNLHEASAWYADLDEQQDVDRVG